MANISPRVDIAFKKIFGVDENKDLLIALINAIVSAEDRVAEVTLLNPYNPKNFANDKLSILDIKAEGENGKRYNIEIQISDEANYDKRALYYWAKMYTEQLKSAEDYGNLSKAIGIHMNNASFRKQRGNGLYAKLSCFLHHKIHFFTFRDNLSQMDEKWRFQIFFDLFSNF